MFESSHGGSIKRDVDPEMEMDNPMKTKHMYLNKD